MAGILGGDPGDAAQDFGGAHGEVAEVSERRGDHIQCREFFCHDTDVFSKPNDTTDGARAETLAAAYLSRRGLRIETRNFRVRGGEIDLICREGATLVFVEVRLRRNAGYGGAAASITKTKRQRLILAARHYLARVPDAPAVSTACCCPDWLTPTSNGSAMRFLPTLIISLVLALPTPVRK